MDTTSIEIYLPVFLDEKYNFFSADSRKFGIHNLDIQEIYVNIYSKH